MLQFLLKPLCPLFILTFVGDECYVGVGRIAHRFIFLQNYILPSCRLDSRHGVLCLLGEWRGLPAPCLSVERQGQELAGAPTERSRSLLHSLTNRG